jgi:SAM-dependent methyltransferase
MERAPPPVSWDTLLCPTRAPVRLAEVNRDQVAAAISERNMQQEGPEFYDRMHAGTDLATTRTRYDALFRKVIEKLRERGSRSILEIGCGSGFLAELILKEHRGIYHGFDFSSEAIGNAGTRTGRPGLFSVGNALDPGSYADDYDTIVCTEVLEHVDCDLDVIRLWRDGATCICSVPNFDWPGHVRFFNTTGEVEARYGALIEIEAVHKIPRPLIPDRRISSYLRSLRWSRNNPSELLGFLGIQTFARLGGWFLFYGTKREQEHVSTALG